MTGQGKQMPGMAARDSQEDDASVPECLASDAKPVAPASAAAGADGAPDAFDAWLRDELLRLYGCAVNEPVPADMIRLLQAAIRTS